MMRTRRLLRVYAAAPASALPCWDWWALLWLCFKTKTVRVSPELNFCWPTDPATAWEQCKIFHNAGIESAQSNKYFCKTHYTRRDPYYDDFSFVNRNTCCYHYVKLIEATARQKKYSLPDVTFLITLRVDSADRIDNVLTILEFLSTHFQTNILLVEADSSPRFMKEKIPEGVRYIFSPDSNPVFYRQRYYNKLVKMCDTDIVIKYDTDVILPPSQIYNAVLSIRKNDVDVCYPFDGNFLMVPENLKKYFVQNKDIRLLYRFKRLFQHYYPSYGGCIALRKSTYIRIGMDNINFNGWGFEDQELFKRSKILECKVSREEGPLFHLHHARGTHSWYFDQQEEVNSHREYIKVCNMNKEELENYIATWEK